MIVIFTTITTIIVIAVLRMSAFVASKKDSGAQIALIDLKIA